MAGFLMRYLLVAALGSAAIYYGVPRLRSFEEAPESPPRANERMNRTPRSLDADAASWRKPPDAFGGATNSPGTSSVPARLDVDRETLSEAPVVVETVTGFTPSTDTIPPSGAPISHWGIVVVDAAAYRQDGRRLANQVPGGTLVEQTDTVTTSKGEMALCKVWVDGRWDGPCLLPTADLWRVPGTRDNVSATDMHNLCRYFFIQGQIESRKARWRKRLLDSFPRSQELRRAYAEYETARKRSQELTAQRDEATGQARTDMANELRKLQAEAPRLQQRLKRLNEEYQAWKQARADDPRSDFENDPDVRALRGELGQLEARLDGWVL